LDVKEVKVAYEFRKSGDIMLKICWKCHYDNYSRVFIRER